MMQIVFFDPPIEAEPYCWLGSLGINYLGVHEQDGWCMKLGERIVVFDTEEKFVPLGPILDLSNMEFQAHIEKSKIASPKYARVIDAFPKIPLLKHIFHTSVSSYWPEKALLWIDNDPAALRLLYEEIERFSLNKVMPQQARQKAKKMLSKLRTD